MKKISPLAMFAFGILTFIIIMRATHNMVNLTFDSPHFWFYRVLTALAAAAISISIPGMLKLNHFVETSEKGAAVKTYEKVGEMSLYDKEPTISASGAIAVFVLVYLFNPVL